MNEIPINPALIGLELQKKLDLISEEVSIDFLIELKKKKFPLGVFFINISADQTSMRNNKIHLTTISDIANNAKNIAINFSKGSNPDFIVKGSCDGFKIQYKGEHRPVLRIKIDQNTHAYIYPRDIPSEVEGIIKELQRQINELSQKNVGPTHSLDFGGIFRGGAKSKGIEANMQVLQHQLEYATGRVKSLNKILHNNLTPSVLKVSPWLQGIPIYTQSVPTTQGVKEVSFLGFFGVPSKKTS